MRNTKRASKSSSAGEPTDFTKVRAALRRPSASWTRLSAARLATLVRDACLLYGFEAPEWREELTATYEVACDRLPVAKRVDVVLAVGSAVERLHLESPPTDQFGLTNAFAVFIGVDTNPRVVSTAALELACLIPAWEGDTLAGPRQLTQFALEQDYTRCQAAMIASLLATGDRRVVDLLEPHWSRLRRSLPEVGELLPSIPHITALDLAVRWSRAAVAAGDIDAIEILASALDAIRNRAATEGLTEFRGMFPVTDALDEPLRLIRDWRFDDVVAFVRYSLGDLLRPHTHPGVLRSALGRFGIEDTLLGAVDHGAETGVASTRPTLRAAATDGDGVQEDPTDRPPTERELRLTACLYAEHNVAEYLRQHGRLPDRVGGPWSTIPLRLVVQERGFNPILTADEQLILDAIIREDRLPGLVVCVAAHDDTSGEPFEPFAFVRFGEQIAASNGRPQPVQSGAASNRPTSRAHCRASRNRSNHRGHR
jgi:hypothetical protein